VEPSPAIRNALLLRPPLSGLPVVIACALLITLAFWAVLPAGLRGNTNSDFDTFYEPVARSLLAGEGLTTAEGRPALRYPPGYAALLALVFAVAGALAIPESLALAGFTLLCVALGAALVYALARLLWGPSPAALIALAWASYPPMLWSTKQPNSETPFTVCFYAGVLLFWYAYSRRSRPWPLLVAAGVCIGLSMLIRPLALSVPPAMALFLLLGRRHRGALARLGLLAAFVVGCLAPVLPWQAWMYAQSGRLHLLSSGGPSSMRDGLTFAVDRRDRRSGYTAPPDVAAVMERLRERGGEMRSFGAVAQIVGEQLRRDPAPTLKLLGIKALRSLYATDSERFELPSILMQCFYLGLIGLGLRRAWRRGGELRDYALLIGLLLLCFWGATFLVLSILRYTAPMIALALTILPALLPRSRLGAPAAALAQEGP
jgi:4-amino-4-deoxy-L-arabinose transferase-like glycosyltransferase